MSDKASERVLEEMKEEFVRDELPRVFRAMQLLDIDLNELADYLARHNGVNKR